MITALFMAVPHRDFFAYCTTLKPLELKAIGELSYIQHLAPGRIIFAAGDTSSAIYIVSRGAVELVSENAIPGVEVPTLVRGDFVGDTETLIGAPRRQTARARTPVSIQCIQREDFAELMRRAPSFFFFLSEHLAARLQRSEIAAAQTKDERLELHGNLANFDLITIYQTIVSSQQTGELRIFNETAELISVFFFEEGQPRGGQFQHITGEDAFMQLFLSDTLAGSFLFSSEGRVSACIQPDLITRSANDMLIHAVQARDELDVLKHRFPDPSATLHRRKLNFTWPEDAPPELLKAAEHIWHIAFSTPLALGALYQRGGFSELKIYEAVEVLVATGHFELSSAAEAQVA
jgi:CRP-like cAMP-binding protein